MNQSKRGNRPLLATLQDLGVVTSFSRPSVSDDNPFSEALFRTLKYRPDFPGTPFASLDHARQWVNGFVRWYNTEHLHSGLCFVTPDDRHFGRDHAILQRRTLLYELARQQRPERWPASIRNWKPNSTVYLNPAMQTATTRKPAPPSVHATRQLP